MYIDTQFRAAKPPVRTPEPRFSGGSVATSLLVHALLAVGLVLLAHRAVLRAPPTTPAIPMIFLAPPPPAPAPVPAAAPAPVPPPPVQAEPPPKAEPQPAPPPPMFEPPLPVPAPPPPPPAVKETRPPPEPKVEHRRAPVRPERRRPARREQQRASTPPDAFAPAEPAPMPRPAPPVAMETGPIIPPRPLSYQYGNRPPVYPESLRARGVQGHLVLRVAVTADGRVASISLASSSGVSRLDASAVDAVRGWRFVPATRGGRPIPGVAEVPINFQLAN